LQNKALKCTGMRLEEVIGANSGLGTFGGDAVTLEVQ
jgi:hypothetical protein